jgi:hypothetical protein
MSKYLATMFVAGSEAWRKAVKIDKVREMLEKTVAGEYEPSQAQLKAAELLLRKCVPDLKAVEHHHSDRPKTAQDYTDAEIIALLERTGARRARRRVEQSTGSAELTAEVCGVHDATLVAGKNTSRH